MLHCECCRKRKNVNESGLCHGCFKMMARSVNPKLKWKKVRVK